MHWLIKIALFSLVFSCQKASERSCWKVSGSVAQTKLPLTSFSYLHVHPHLEVTLVQDSVNYVAYDAGNNLLPFISAKIEKDTLQLQNNNRCRFFRYRSGDVKVEVHYKSLKELHLDNSELVTNANQWSEDEVLIFLKEGVGKVKLDLGVQKVTVRNNYGWQTLQLSGAVGSLFVDLDGSAAIQASTLVVQDSISFRSASPLASWIRVNDIKLKAQLYSTGDLFYSGLFSSLLKTEYSTGRVLPK